MSLRCLTELYTPAGLLIDGDGDGLPDGFGARFVVGQTPGAIDVAARLGLESAAFTPGFTQADAEGVPVFFGPANPACPPTPMAVPPGCGLVALVPEGLLVTGADPEAGWAAARWLAETFPYAAHGGPLLAQMAGGQQVTAVVLREGAVLSLQCGELLPDSAADKPTGEGAPAEPPFHGEPVGDLPPAGVGQLFTVAGLMGSSDGVCHDRAGWQVAVDEATTAAEIAGLCELAARTGVEATGLRFPLAVKPGAGQPRVALCSAPPAEADWRWELPQGGGATWGAGGLKVYGTAQQRAEALCHLAASGLVDGLHASLFTRRAALPEAPVRREAPLFDLTLQAEWEVDRFRRLWQTKVLPSVLHGQPMSVEVRISEPLAIRQALAAEMEASLAAAGVTEAVVRVRSAYKQAYHWLEEEMLPLLSATPGLARVEVTCPRFTAAAAVAQPEAGLGAGAAPQPGKAGGLRGPEGGVRDGGPLEMPIRWLQELYPADELLGAALGVSVQFGLGEAEAEPTYRLTAYGADGQPLLTQTFRPIHTAQDYLPEFPLRGRVHPATGWVEVEQGGRTLCSQRLETDAERLWSAYQAEVLPRLKAYLVETYGTAPDPARQPFFGALVIEASLSEEDRRLGIREEQVSPLDAMHEDLYFYTLDYLNELGTHLAGQGYPAPGAVEPWIRAGQGGPQARVRLYAAPADLAEGHLADRLPERAARLPQPAAGLTDAEVIGPDQLPAYLAYLATLPGVRVWRTGLSLAGRATWALSVTQPTAGRIAPPQKLSAWRPTLMVNARRHANEISSTNSILRLAERAATGGLTRQVNLVLSPMENADGAAIHYAMQQEHPHWKLHAARFNAAGVDFGYDSFSPAPRFGEARTLPTLWRSFLPDVVLDDHGYPSHEWVQPFSGYNSAPYFRTSWWMPSAMIYGIHRWLEPEAFPRNHAVQQALRDRLAQRLTADPAIEGYTEILLDRYRMYGQRYVPEKFPLQMHQGFVSMLSKVAAGPDARTFAGRFPHITAAELVTEVPDETAQDEHLARCAHAHVEGDLAVIDVLTAQRQPVIRRRFVEADGSVCWLVGRERPLRV